MEYPLEILKKLANDKKDFGQNLIARLSTFSSLNGVLKLQRKILQEIKFLEKVTLTEKLKPCHILCSNLTHYALLVDVLETQKEVVEVLRKIHFNDGCKCLQIDIICEAGRKWIKVIARKTKSLNEAARGCSSYGAKSIVDQAREFIEAAEQNVYMYSPPTVVFQFAEEFDAELENALQAAGVNILITSSAKIDTRLNIIDTLNLDITAMLAYVSNLTNGNNCWLFNELILNQQALWEKENPVKIVLEKAFEGRQLICCETAQKSFLEIVSIIGGTNEKLRAGELMSRVTVWPDVDFIPRELNRIQVGGKIKSRSLKVFAFGMVRKSITATSNEGFLRSAKMKGIDIPAVIIGARALTESKEEFAKKMMKPMNNVNS